MFKLIQEDNDGTDCLLFPHIPPPLPPKKKFKNPMARPVNQNSQQKYSCGVEGQDTYSIDLITFEEEKETEQLTEIASDDSGYSMDRVSIERRLEHVHVEPEKKEIPLYTESQTPTENLEAFLKDDFLKSSFDFDGGGITSRTPNVDMFSYEEGHRQHMNDVTATNPFISISDASKQIFSTPTPQTVHCMDRHHLNDAMTTNPFTAEPEKQKSPPQRRVNKYTHSQSEKFAFELESPSSVDNRSEENYPRKDRRNEEGIMFKSLSELNISFGEDIPYIPDGDVLFTGENMYFKQQNNPFWTFDIVTESNDRERCLQKSEADETISTTGLTSEESPNGIQSHDCDYQVDDNIVAFNSDSWPKVCDMNPFIPEQLSAFPSPCSNSKTRQLAALPSPYSVDSSTDLYLNTTQHGSKEVNECALYDRPAPCTPGEKNDSQNNSSDEDEYVHMSPNVNQYHTYHNTHKEAQQNAGKVVSKDDANGTSHRAHKPRPPFTSQHSLSDSAIYNPDVLEDHKIDTGMLCKDSYGKPMKKCQNKHIKFKAKLFLSKFIKRNGKNSQISPTKQGGYLNLSCACGGSCDRIGNLVTSSEGQMWVSFLHCSWVSLYDHRFQFLRKFDAGGIVDDLAVSPSGVLYISCPQLRKILMLSTNLELRTMCQFKKMHPRGLAISLRDGSVVACMTSEAIGHLMRCPKNNSLMKFEGKGMNEIGHVLNKGDFLGYPMRLAINVNGFIIVSDFGLSCLFVLNQGGLMLKKLTILGERPLYQVHSITCGKDCTFYIVQGGRGKLTITRLREHRGCVTQETVKRLDPDIYCKVRTCTIDERGHLVVTSGTVVKKIDY